MNYFGGVIMDNLVSSFSDSIFDPSIEIGEEILELGVDAVLEDGLLKDIPIVGTVVSIGKMYVNLRERNFLRQTLAFLHEFKLGAIDAYKLEEHIRELKGNKALFEKELGTILVYLDKNTEISKSRMDANMYLSLLHGEISFDEFCEFLEITNRMFLSDISVLKEVYENEGVSSDMEISYRHDRLISLGLLRNGGRFSITKDNGLQYTGDDSLKNILMTTLGEKYCNCIFNERTKLYLG